MFTHRQYTCDNYCRAKHVIKFYVGIVYCWFNAQGLLIACTVVMLKISFGDCDNYPLWFVAKQLHSIRSYIHVKDMCESKEMTLFYSDWKLPNTHSLAIV